MPVSNDLPCGGGSQMAQREPQSQDMDIPDAQTLVSIAEMNVALEHFDVTKEQGVKAFAFWAIETALQALSLSQNTQANATSAESPKIASQTGVPYNPRFQGKVERHSDQSVLVKFPSCHLATEFEHAVSNLADVALCLPGILQVYDDALDKAREGRQFDNPCKPGSLESRAWELGTKRGKELGPIDS